MGVELQHEFIVEKSFVPELFEEIRLRLFRAEKASEAFQQVLRVVGVIVIILLALFNLFLLADCRDDGDLARRG